LLTFAIAVCCGAALLSARGASRRRAAVMLAAGSGIAFGYVAALTEHIGHLLNEGLVHLLATWVPYALVVAATVSLLFAQSAFHAGALRLSLPTLVVSQPIVGVAIGIAFFGEHINSRGFAPFFEVLGLALVTFGVFALAQSAPMGMDPEVV
jgi:hypothetical protein